MTATGFTYVTVKTSLGTKEVIVEIQKILGSDKADRRPPKYMVIHRAVVELRDRLKAEKTRASQRSGIAASQSSKGAKR